jgi:hypothetical protein
MAEETQVAPEQTQAKQVPCDPSELTRGTGDLPREPHTFKMSDGSKKTILLSGLTYPMKNEVDVWARERRQENPGQPDMWYPAIIARAACKPNGKFAYPNAEQWIPFAVQLAEHALDASIHRAFQAVIKLSGYGKDAEEEAGKD